MTIRKDTVVRRGGFSFYTPATERPTSRGWTTGSHNGEWVLSELQSVRPIATRARGVTRSRDVEPDVFKIFRLFGATDPDVAVFCRVSQTSVYRWRWRIKPPSSENRRKLLDYARYLTSMSAVVADDAIYRDLYPDAADEDLAAFRAKIEKARFLLNEITKEAAP